VRLWAHEKEVRDSIAEQHINQLFLPEYPVPSSVTCTNDLQQAVDRADIVVGVMPSHHCRKLFESTAANLKPEMLFVSATKGLENDTLLRMTDIITQVVTTRCGFRPRIGALSGPSFAKEVARGDPTAITIASSDAELAQIVQREFSDPWFRVYTNDDVIGVELGGALKNIVAIAAGICDGLHLGHNSVAALITRGLAEITRLVVSCGGRPETMAGLAALAISYSPVPAVCRATAASEWNWAVVAACRKSCPQCMAWWQRVSLPPMPRSVSPALAMLKCRLPSRCTPSCNRERPLARPFTT
jgi:glycerol-3-phosphate dehydrogenase (NAD(P)+)